MDNFPWRRGPGLRGGGQVSAVLHILYLANKVQCLLRQPCVLSLVWRGPTLGVVQQSSRYVAYTWLLHGSSRTRTQAGDVGNRFSVEFEDQWCMNEVIHTAICSLTQSQTPPA